VSFIYLLLLPIPITSAILPHVKRYGLPFLNAATMLRFVPSGSASFIEKRAPLWPGPDMPIKA
jgi:hypothetical protein